jgi:hypothetical protein
MTSPADLTDEELIEDIGEREDGWRDLVAELARRLRAANEARRLAAEIAAAPIVGLMERFKEQEAQLSASNERIAKLDRMVRKAVGCIDTRTHDGVFWSARADLKERLLAQLDGGETT